jgi:hypothetical protein
MVMARIADLSDSIYVNFYRQQAECIMGDVSASEFRKIKNQEDQEALNAIFTDALFRPYQFNIKVNLRTYNEETKMNFACLKAFPVESWSRENRQLLRRLEIYQNIPEPTAAQ